MSWKFLLNPQFTVIKDSRQGHRVGLNNCRYSKEHFEDQHFFWKGDYNKYMWNFPNLTKMFEDFPNWKGTGPCAKRCCDGPQGLYINKAKCNAWQKDRRMKGGHDKLYFICPSHFMPGQMIQIKKYKWKEQIFFESSLFLRDVWLETNKEHFNLGL